MRRSARQLQIVNRGRSLPSTHTISRIAPLRAGLCRTMSIQFCVGLEFGPPFVSSTQPFTRPLLVWMSGPLGVQYHEILYTALITTSFALPREHSECKKGRVSCAKPVRVIRGTPFLSSGPTDSIHLSTLAVRRRFTASGRHRTTPPAES